MAKLPREKFIEKYAERAGLSSRWAILGFVELGGDVLICMPCGCGEDGCEGWAMLGPTNIEHHLKFNAPEPLKLAYLAALEANSND